MSRPRTESAFEAQGPNGGTPGDRTARSHCAALHPRRLRMRLHAGVPSESFDCRRTYAGSARVLWRYTGISTQLIDRSRFSPYRTCIRSRVTHKSHFHIIDGQAFGVE